MSWFKSNVSTVQLDNKITEATSETIPNGELELSVALEITDLIRSKKLPAKQCMRSLKKRLTLVHSNPNLTTSTLKLIDLCVKNLGFHFLVEIASREFMDYLVDVIFKHHYNTKTHTDDESKMQVGNFVLGLVQSWTKLFANQLQLTYVEKRYQGLENEGFSFPDSEEPLNSTFVDSEVPPDWIDNDSCMICYNPFLMINRKHHCRACGGVFCQTHSSHNVPLVAMGIKEELRVCDNCYLKYKPRLKARLETHRRHSEGNRGDVVEEEDEELRKAIELSLKDSGVEFRKPSQSQFQPPSVPSRPTVDAEDDEDMKAAIAASLKEFEEQERFQREYGQPAQQPQAQPQPSQSLQAQESSPSDFYNDLLPVPNESNPFTNHAPPQNFQGQNFQPPQNVQPPQPPPQEDLTQKEEEQINLFITLVNSVKNDPKKRANVLYDSDLSELHVQIIRLKPKVNRSLRLAIEKYETFLELNNKISMITRLYDEFLEKKLSYAYGNHHVEPGYFEATPYENAQNTQQITQQNTQQNTGQQIQQNTGQQLQQSTGQQLQQVTGHQVQQTTGQSYDTYGTGYQEQPRKQNAHLPQQSTGYNHSFNDNQAAQPAYSYQDQYTGNAPYKRNSYEAPSAPDSEPALQTVPAYTQSTPAQQIPAQQIPAQQVPAQPAQAQPIAANYPTTYITEPEEEQFSTISQFPEVPEATPHARKESGSYPLVYPEDNGYELLNEAVNPSLVRRVSTTVSEDAVEQASERFPTLEDMPVIQRVKLFVAEPEPLIEL